MPVGKERVTEVIDYAMTHGDARASEVYSLPVPTLERYRRKYKEIYGEGAALYLALKKQFTDSEIKGMIRSGKSHPKEKRDVPVDIEGTIIKFGVISDTHVGHKEFNEAYLYTAFTEIEKRGCDFTVHAGDVTEGLMNRPGHFYECNQYGYKAQRDEAVRVLSPYKRPLYVVNGNHDTSINSKLGVGADVVEDICDRIPNARYLPGDPADLRVNGITIRLFHGKDRGGSYAKTNRGQKIVDSFGTDIPDILITGHSHTADYCKYRGCHILDAGSIQRLTDFQRGNKLTADVGFWVVEIVIRDAKIQTFTSTFYDLEEIMYGK